jgi:tRNA threonylcarbamoyladenosine dehydratase
MGFYKEDDDEYWELYTRNFPVINQETQKKIRSLKVAIAGCGSTGGAFTDGILRLGVTNYHLCDNGTYDLSNLNRQMVSRKDIGKNKATVYAERIKDVNPAAHVRHWPEGLTPENIHEFLKGSDLLFDAVDVTTEAGMAMKLLLHETAAKYGIPTASALDLGFGQRIEGFNYHQGIKALHGRIELAKKCKHPLQALFAGFLSIDDLPYEFMDELERLLKDAEAGACQLACACFLLSSMTTPMILYFLKNKALQPLNSINMLEYYETEETLNSFQILKDEKVKYLKKLLEHTK